jgi:phthiodiolone/phenolphthiodiolone dimycocerosates ketoreductase
LAENAEATITPAPGPGTNKAGVELDVPIGLSRYLPPAAVADTARAYEASGVIDSVIVWDQLTFFHPRSLWRGDDVPMAAVMPDVDSFPDPVATLAYASCAAPTLGLSLATDAVRRSPAELLVTMLTLGNMTGRRATLQLGAGEIKQCQPFGWKRKEALGRMEDHLRAFRAMSASPGPVDFDGRHWTFDQAWIGGARQYWPRVWCLGGGPRLLELAARYADGFSTMAPGVANGGDGLREIVAAMRERVANFDRDPNAFQFALFPAALLIHEDENVIDRGLEHPFIKWMTAIFGRINQADWLKEGIDPPRPDWHYAMNLLPIKVSDAERDEVLSRVTREMSEKSWIFGTPEQVAAQLQPYVEAGACFINLADTLPFVLEPDDAQQSVARTIEVARILKGHLARSTDPASAPAGHSV